MELLKLKRRKSRLSDLAYTALNLGLALAVLLSINITGTPWIALILVILSKWRIFAVRPRFWRANVLANLVDVFVGLSIVLLIYVSMTNIALQIILTVFWIAWLLIIKPQSKRSFVFLQAAIALFLSVMALMLVSYEWDVFFVVILMWLIGFSVSRHILTNFDEPFHGIYSTAFGLIMAELGWIGHHWSFAYAPPGFRATMVGQSAIFALLILVICYQFYAHKHDSKEKKAGDWYFPIIFSVLTIIILLIFLNTPQGGQGGI